jgi:hypothetical protein
MKENIEFKDMLKDIIFPQSSNQSLTPVNKEL